MRISRIYTEQPLSSGQTAELSGQCAHYISKVLRLGINAPLIVFNGDGTEYEAEITSLEKKSLSIALKSQRSPATESACTTILAIGISRGERMDYVIQKSTELGVSTIIPLFTEFSEVKLKGDRLQKRQQHWQGIAISACEQSGRVKIPEIAPAQGLLEWLKSSDTKTDKSVLKLLCDHQQTTPLSQLLDSEQTDKRIVLLVGPEGGISEAEKTLAFNQGFEGLNLGPRVLRTETAPVVALSLIQSLWG